MPEEDQKKPETTPHRMKRIAWPNAKYGVYLAITIIIVVLLIFYRDLIFQIIYFMAKDLSKIAKQKKIMENKKEENKNQTPPKMARLAWPKAKYGVYLALFIIIFILLILYKDLIL